MRPLYILSAGLAASCSPEVTAPEPGVVALVDGVEITETDLRDRFWGGSDDDRNKSQRAGGRHHLVDLVIEDRLLAFEAQRRKLSPRYRLTRSYHKKLMKRFLDDEFEPTVNPSDIPEGEVRAEYSRLLPDLDVPHRRLIRILVEPSQERASEVIDMIISKIEADDMSNLLQLLRDESVQEKGGGTGRFSEEEALEYLGEELTEIAFSTAPEDFVHKFPVKYGSRWGVVVIEETYTARAAPGFEEVEDQIRQRLHSSRREEALNSFVNSFREEHRVKVYRGMLELVP